MKKRLLVYLLYSFLPLFHPFIDDIRFKTDSQDDDCHLEVISEFACANSCNSVSEGVRLYQIP